MCHGRKLKDGALFRNLGMVVSAFRVANTSEAPRSFVYRRIVGVDAVAVFRVIERCCCYILTAAHREHIDLRRAAGRRRSGAPLLIDFSSGTGLTRSAVRCRPIRPSARSRSRIPSHPNIGRSRAWHGPDLAPARPPRRRRSPGFPRWTPASSFAPPGNGVPHQCPVLRPWGRPPWSDGTGRCRDSRLWKTFGSHRACGPSPALALRDREIEASSRSWPSPAGVRHRRPECNESVV